MANLRAFATCLAFALAAVASNANAQLLSIDLVNIGNAGNPSNTTTGLGSVSGTFSMSRTETTNAQYAAFLNKVDPNGTNPFGIYNSLMGSAVNGGILNTGTVNGARYVLKTGAPAGTPAGTSYANMPVNYVTWFSAARFTNWLQNGQTSGTSGINSGAYILGSATSGSIVARQAGATYFLPSNNEWYKAAFYNATSGTYTRFSTNSNTQPANTIASGSLANPNSANWGNTATPTTSPINVNAYVNTTSAYGLYSMFGNVLEMTDTAGSAGQYRVFGGNYNTTQANVTAGNWTVDYAGIGVSSTILNPGYGFRVASSQIAPVPEPETITLAAFGIVGLCGANWLRRRRKTAGQPVSTAEILAA